MTQPNPYDSLRIDCLEDAVPVDATTHWHVTESRQETVVITNAVLPDGLWVYGYIVHWSKGSTSRKNPTAQHGKFRSQREAQLHAIGFMKAYLNYFRPDTQEAIRAAEGKLLQTKLF